MPELFKFSTEKQVQDPQTFEALYCNMGTAL
jgi:hypothetical protein